MICGICHIKHNYFISNFHSQGLYQLSNQLVQLFTIFFKEVERCIPNDSIKFFLFNHPIYQIDSLMKFRKVTSNCLKEFNVVSFNIDSRNQLDVLVNLFDSRCILSIIIMLILKSRIIVFTDFQCIPARTDIVNFMRIFQCVLKALFVPRGQEDELLKIGKILLIIVKLNIIKEDWKVVPFQGFILLKRDMAQMDMNKGQNGQKTEDTSHTLINKYWEFKQLFKELQNNRQRKMYELVEMYETVPHSKRINMQFKNLKDITQMVPILAKFKYLAQISFHGNKITFLPPLERLKNLKAIDLTNNPIKIDHFLLDRLNQLTELQDLYIDCSREERQSIVQNIQKLKSINGEKIVRQIFQLMSLEQELKILQSKLTQQMKKMKQTYSRMSQSLESPQNIANIGATSARKRVQDEQFNFIYNDIQEEMTYFYSGLRDRLSRQGVYAYCKNKMTIILDNLMVKVLDQITNDSIIKIYEEISKIKNENFDLLLRIIFNTSYEQHVNQEIDKPSNRLRKETLYQNQIFRLKKEILELKKEQGKIQRIQDREQKLNQPKRPQIKSPVNSNSKGFERSSSVGKFPKKSPSAKSIGKTPTLSRSPSVKATTKGMNNTISKNENNSSYGNRTPSKPNQLLKLIEEIMCEKRKYNLRSLSKNEVFQTSQQFIFTFFTRRYGLKEVALQWSLSLIKAIQLYCKQSIQVQIFGKILKNQLYEEYYDEFKEFGKEIQRVYKDSKVDKTRIQQNLFKKIFFYFFSYQNDQTFNKIVKSFTFPITSVQHTYFLQSYKLAFEEKHLVAFLQLFEKLDSDDDSALNTKQAKELIYNLIRSNKAFNQDEASSKLQQYSAILQTFKKSKFIFSQLFQLMHKLL